MHWRVASETEVQSKMDYDESRSSKFMVDLIQKQREKSNRQMSKNVKQLKHFKMK